MHLLKSKGRSLDIVAFNVLLNGLSNTGDFSGMNLLLVEMKEMGIVPNVITYSP